MKTELLNLKKIGVDALKEPGVIYIGRRIPSMGIMEDSPFANPFKVEVDNPGNRLDAIALYRDHILASDGTRAKLGGLRTAKALVCWCAPKICHGLVLLELAEAMRHHDRECGDGCNGTLKSVPKYVRDGNGRIFESYQCNKCGWKGIGEGSDMDYLKPQAELF